MDTTKRRSHQQLRVFLQAFHETWGPLLGLALAITVGILALSGN